MLKFTTLIIAFTVALGTQTDCNAQVIVRSSPTSIASSPFETGADAWRAFRPLVAPADSGGECRKINVGPASLPSYVMYFPNSTSALTQIALWVDDKGTLLKSQETRNSIAATPLSGSIPPVTRDSIFRARQTESKHTAVNLDFVRGVGDVRNQGDGMAKPYAVRGEVKMVDSMSLLGNPGARARHAVAVCNALPPQM